MTTWLRFEVHHLERGKKPPQHGIKSTIWRHAIPLVARYAAWPRAPRYRNAVCGLFNPFSMIPASAEGKTDLQRSMRLTVAAQLLKKTQRGRPVNTRAAGSASARSWNARGTILATAAAEKALGGRCCARSACLDGEADEISMRIRRPGATAFRSMMSGRPLMTRGRRRSLVGAGDRGGENSRLS
jgi:hypothetical protein